MSPALRRQRERRLASYLREHERPMSPSKRRQLNRLIREKVGLLNAAPPAEQESAQ
jgi:hypothetical protein